MSWIVGSKRHIAEKGHWKQSISWRYSQAPYNVAEGFSIIVNDDAMQAMNTHLAENVSEKNVCTYEAFIVSFAKKKSHYDDTPQAVNGQTLDLAFVDEMTTQA